MATFYDRIKNGGNYVAKLQAAEGLLDHMYELGGDFGSPSSVAMGDIIPDVDFAAHSERQAREQFYLFPVRAIGPLVESRYSEESVGQWYQATIKTILKHTPEHTDRCMARIEKLLPLGCSKSINCPRKVLLQLTMDPVLYPDFDDLDYLVDPRRRARVVVERLDAAVAANLQLEAPADAAIERYKALAEEALGVRL